MKTPKSRHTTNSPSKAPSCFAFLVTPSPHPKSLATSDLFSTVKSLACIDNFCECQIKGIIMYTTFWNWVLSLGIMSLRFIQVQCINSLFLCKMYQLVYPFTCWRALRWCLAFNYHKFNYCEQSCTSFYVNEVFISLGYIHRSGLLGVKWLTL